ncbi:MAG: Type 1 glutamine amidotransferase-like domain-containing protein [Patescibacteria group bacterium]
MKFFLASTNITTKLQTHFLSLVGKKFEDIKFALIENAADPYSEDEKGFVYETRNTFESLNMQLEIIDLREYVNNKNDVYDNLKKFDVVWIGGGNVFYLRWIFKESGLDAVIAKLLNEGTIYGGGSAGAIIAGPSLKKFELVDDINKSPEIVNTGLSLINLIVIPHWGQKKYQIKLQEIKDYYEATNYNLTTISDDQALLINENDQNIYP